MIINSSMCMPLICLFGGNGVVVGIGMGVSVGEGVAVVMVVGMGEGVVVGDNVEVCNGVDCLTTSVGGMVVISAIVDNGTGVCVTTAFVTLGGVQEVIKARIKIMGNVIR